MSAISNGNTKGTRTAVNPTFTWRFTVIVSWECGDLHAARLEAGKPSRTFTLLIAGDALVAPDCRDRGLVSRILKAAYGDLAEREYDYVVSLGGASRINALGLMALGWKSGGGLQPMGRTSTAAKRSRNVRQTLKRIPLLWRFGEARSLYFADQRRPFRHLDRMSLGTGVGAHPRLSWRGPRASTRWSNLVLRHGHDGRIRYVRDREYLAWRFQNPLGDYRFLYWEDSAPRRLSGAMQQGERSRSVLPRVRRRPRGQQCTRALGFARGRSALGTVPEIVT